LKRSNRLVLLVGVFLAVIAFVGVLLLSQGGGGGTGGPDATPTEATVVVAAADIPLGTVMEAEMLETTVVPIDGVNPGAFTDPSQAIGQVARAEVIAGQQITTAITQTGPGTITDVNTPAGYRAMSVMVDQVSGVGTLIKSGDWVDMVIRMDVKPVIVDEEAQTATAIDAVDGDTSKLLLQGMQVLGTLLPPAAPAAEGGAASPQPGTALTERQQLVILALTPEQVEVVKWAQNEEQVSMSLVLRSPDDFVDAEGNRLTPESPCLTTRPAPTPTPVGSPEPAASEAPIPPFPCEITPGVVLDTLIARYGVLIVDIEGGVIGGSIPTAPAVPTETPAESPAVSPAP
jgi:pilus assembly protein CpaB